MSNNKPKIIKNIVFALLIITLFAYGIYNSRILIAGPQIEILEPQNGSTIENSPLIRVTGTVENIAFIKLNDRQINVDENSYFDEPVLLYPGYNIIKVSAEDKFQRTVDKQVEVIYREEDSIDLMKDFLEENENISTSTATTTQLINTFEATSSLEEI